MDPFTQFNRFLSRHLTPAVKTIFLINTGVFVGIQIGFLVLPQTVVHHLIDLFGQNPRRSLGTLFVWQFLTYMFIHLNLFHILFNMIILWFFAPDLEDRWGSSRFWRFYLVTGIGAALLHAVIGLLTRPGGTVIGASGALMGVLVAFWAYYPQRVVYLYGALPILVKWLVPLIVLLDLLLLRSDPRVSHLTHLAGVVVSYAYLARYHRTNDFTKWKYLG
jgi:membrane associated rhomboid family serine protease